MRTHWCGIGARLGRMGVVFRPTLGFLVVGFLALGLGTTAFAQDNTATASVVEDPALVAAQKLVGKALFLRGFYAANDLKYDPQGRTLDSAKGGAPKVVDWTLAGVNVLKAERRTGEMELEGVRVAIRYNPEQHQFERHALNDDKMKILIGVGDSTGGGAKGFEAAVAAIFSVGIDPALQRSMPDFWQHYFNPSLEWPADELTGATLYATFGLPNQAKDVVPAKLEHRTDAKFTNYAERDRVKGTMTMRLAVDAEGVPRRITVLQPLGYGLDERAVEAVTKWRFAPGTREGKPVATGLVISQEFEVVPVRR